MEGMQRTYSLESASAKPATRGCKYVTPSFIDILIQHFVADERRIDDGETSDEYSMGEKILYIECKNNRGTFTSTEFIIISVQCLYAFERSLSRVFRII